MIESRHPLYLLEGIVGDKPVAELSTNDCRAFFDPVVNWPKHATKRPEFAGLSVREVLKKAEALNEPKPAAATLNRHHQRLSAFLNWFKTNKVIAENPLLGLVRQDKDEAQEETGRAFTQAELNAIFEPSAYASWVAAIARALNALFEVARKLLSLSEHRVHESTAHANMSAELHAQEQEAPAAVGRAQSWATPHALRVWTSKTFGGKTAASIPWRALIEDAAACQDRVRTLKRVVAGHERNLAAIARDEAPLLARTSRNEQVLTDALEGFGGIEPIYVPQLLAAATEAERKWLAAVMPSEEGSAEAESTDARDKPARLQLVPPGARPQRVSLGV